MPAGPVRTGPDGVFWPPGVPRKHPSLLKKILQLLVGIVLAVALLALSLKGVDLRQVWRLTLAASPVLIVASIGIGVFGHNLLRAWRWRIMLGPEKPGISFYNLFSTTLIGYAASWVLPFRVGEVLRPVLLAEREKIRTSAALTTIVVERLLDGLAVVTLFSVCLSFWAGREGIGEQGEKILGFARTGSVVLLVGTVVLFALLVIGAATRGRWKGRVELYAARTHSRLAAGLARSVIGLVEGGAILTRPIGFAVVAVLSLVIWLVIGWATWLGLKAAGVRITFPETFILMPASVLGIGVPTPGGAGSYEYFVSQTLHHLFRQPLETALAATLVLHVVITVIPVVLVGLALAWRDGVTPARLKAALAAVAGRPSPARASVPAGPSVEIAP